ncbi:MAG: hypothetical protein KJ607_12035 [Bacteroidetes bacterium]|nr:hypothetical protein [Bacteroidota bacterium]
MKKLFLAILLFGLATVVFSQNVAITDDSGYSAHSSAMLDVKSTDKGVLIPRLTTAQRLLVINPATGLLVFDSDEGSFFFYNGTEWLDLSTGNDVWTKSGGNVHLADSSDKVGVGTESPVGKFGIKGDVPLDSSEPLFEVVNSNGDTVFAVYSSGVRVLVADDPVVKTGGNRAGFAVGGFSLSKGMTNEYLRVTPDSVRIFVIDDPSAKASGNKGGFAVGGFSLSKGLTNEYLRVTPDSVRVYIEDTTGLKASGNRGGFAVGGFSLSKGANDSLYMFSDRTGFNVTYLTQAERDAIVDPRMSSLIFNTTDSCLQIFLGYWESIWCTPIGCVYPTVVTHPQSNLIEPGDSAIFTLYATGSKLYYKWQESTDGGNTWIMLEDGGTDPHYNGVHTDSLIITNITVTESDNLYRCLLINACGDVLSNPALLSYWICGQPIPDFRDGQYYATVNINNKCWMAQNLNIGNTITATVGAQANNGIIEKYCYSNTSSNCDTYGGMYEWSELMQYNASDAGNPGTTQGICPNDWHIPTDAEWTALTDYLGGLNVAGGKMKEVGTTHWTPLNIGATNTSGFTGLPGGRYNGSFYDLGGNGYWWSATENAGANAWYRYLYYNTANAYRFDIAKTTSYSVRCIKN